MREIGEYQLGRLLGRGATAHVFLATKKTGNAAPVALKVFHPSLWGDEDNRRRALREYRAAVSLNHPNVVQVIEPLWNENPPAVALEFIDGHSLEEFQPRLPYVLPEVAVLLLVEVLRALEFAHAQGIIHRDLKPANVLISREGQVKVSDFGLAKILDVSHFTATGTILGSPDFMAPEQARGDLTTERSDLFSAAATLYFLVTGTRPFTRHSPLATLAAVCEAEVEPAERRNPKLSAGLARILHRGMAKTPSARFQSAREFREALEAYLRSVGLSEEHFTLAQWMRSPTDSTLDALKTMAQAIARHCEQAVATGDRGAALEALAQLSLVAPESPAIPRLLEELERTQPRSPWIRRGIVAAAVLLFVGSFAIWKTQRSRPTETPQHTTPETAVTAVQEVIPPPSSLQPLRQAAKALSRPLLAGAIRFDVGPDVRIRWDGKNIDPSHPLKGQKVGKHQIEIARPGFKPILQAIQLRSGEPTQIRAR